MLEYNKHLSTIKSVSFEIEYKMYLDKKYSASFSEKKFFIKQEKKKVHVKDDKSVEYYSNDTAIVIADLNHKVLMLIRKDNKKGNEFVKFNEFLDLNFDTLTQNYDSIAIKETPAHQISFTCYFNSNAKCEKIIIKYNQKTKLVETVMYYYRKKIALDESKPAEKHFVTIEVSYKNYNFDYQKIDLYKNINSYLSFYNKGITLTNSYKNFKFIDKYYESN